MLAGRIAIADTASEANTLVNQIGRSILSSNHLPYAEFIITDVPDTFDDYFIKANTWKRVEIYNWGLKFAHDKGELLLLLHIKLVKYQITCHRKQENNQKQTLCRLRTD